MGMERRLGLVAGRDRADEPRRGQGSDPFLLVVVMTFTRSWRIGDRVALAGAVIGLVPVTARFVGRAPWRAVGASGEPVTYQPPPQRARPPLGATTMTIAA